MSRTALLIIDVQDSFLHRPFWQEDDLPVFKEALLRLIDGCKRQNVALVDVFHVATEGPFSLESGFVTRQRFLHHQPDKQVYKHVHNALTDSGLHEWLQQEGIHHLIICGMRTEQCCETTARVASDLGYQVTFVTEATLSASELKHHTETVLNNRFATLSSVEACLAALTPTE